MKKLILTLVTCILLTTRLLAGGEEKSTLTVVVKNLQNSEGQVSVTVFEGEGNFLKKGLEKATQVNTDGTATLIFENLSAGVYAASAIHDMNSNGDLDTGVFGIPTEPYGFSNDARGTFGPASFEDSKFTLSGDKQISITVK